jgi:hypothetical protein
MAHSGRNAMLCITRGDADTSFHADVALKPDTEYRLSGWIKAHALRGNLSLNDHVGRAQTEKVTDREFDTIILDDVLGDARRPVKVLVESKRLLRTGGRVIVLIRARGEAAALKRQLAEYCVAAGLRLSPARVVPPANPEWLVSVATAAEGREAAA